MTDKYTTGPWVIDFSDYDNNGLFFTIKNMKLSYTQEEAMANAQLISAAPDLLEALKKAMWMIESFEGKGDESDMIISSCQNAIWKARGENA